MDIFEELYLLNHVSDVVDSVVKNKKNIEHINFSKILLNDENFNYENIWLDDEVHLNPTFHKNLFIFSFFFQNPNKSYLITFKDGHIILKSSIDSLLSKICTKLSS